VISAPDYDIHPLELAESIRIDDLKVMQSGSETRRIIEEPEPDGQTRLIDQLRILIKDEIRPLILTIEQDVTKNKIMEQELVDAKERAIEADKLKSAFIANMSHEIRTPLNAIVGFSKIIAETDDAADRNTYFSIVEANNERLLGLINEILDLSKIESGIMAFEDNPIKLKDFSEDLLHTLSFKCPPGVDLIYEPAEEELVLLCDRNRLSQVFINLIQNAIKFTSKGSITFGFTKEPSHLQFFVRDTGAGIPAEKIATVFDRFVKADNFTQGTGLGLSICRSIVDRWGGDIWIESEMGKGSTFYFSFPYNKVITDATPEKIAAYGEISYEATNKTLLVAEDTDSNYKLIEAMIGKMYKLVRAHNGLEAVSLFNELHPDLILMDIKMPEMNGLEAATIIRESDKDVPILAQSAFAFEDDRRNAIEMGCTDFIAKPFSKKQLTTTIQRLLLNR
jgi:signal transduction histidine kinase/CheY-like chemotaxis protein